MTVGPLPRASSDEALYVPDLVVLGEPNSATTARSWRRGTWNRTWTRTWSKAWFLAWYIGRGRTERIPGVETGDGVGGVFQVVGGFPLAIFRTPADPVD